MSRLALLVVLPLAFSANAQDKKDTKKEAAPRILYSVPLAVKSGAKQKLALRGKGLAAVREVNVAGAEGATLKVIEAKAVAAPNNHPAERVGDSEVEIELDLPKEAKPGAVKLTAVGAGGDSNAYGLLIGDAQSLAVEKEPNDGFKHAQAINLPAA